MRRPRGDNRNDLCLGEDGSTARVPCAARLPDSARPDVYEGPQCAGASVSVDGLLLRELLLSLDQRNSNCSGAGTYPRRRAEAGDVRCSVLRQQAPESVSNLRGSGRHLIELVRELVRCDGDVISEGERAEVDVLCNDGTARPLGGAHVDAGSAVGHDAAGHASPFGSC